MAALALSLCLLYALAVFGVRALVLRRRGGDSGFAGAATPTEHLANMLVLAAWLLDLLAALLVLAGILEPIAAIDGAVAHVAGAALLCASIALAVLAQEDMGMAWRTGIDPAHPSALVDGGLFAVVRNPVYTTMIGACFGVALLVPTLLSALAVALAVAALEIQVRRVEEPHLRALHGERYVEYARRVGRFVPGIGRLR